jgi:hypothetical protein
MRQRREAERKKKEKELVKQGKKPYFLKKGNVVISYIRVIQFGGDSLAHV